MFPIGGGCDVYEGGAFELLGEGMRGGFIGKLLKGLLGFGMDGCMPLGGGMDVGGSIFGNVLTGLKELGKDILDTGISKGKQFLQKQLSEPSQTLTGEAGKQVLRQNIAKIDALPPSAMTPTLVQIRSMWTKALSGGSLSTMDIIDAASSRIKRGRPKSYIMGGKRRKLLPGQPRPYFRDEYDGNGYRGGGIVEEL